MNSCVDCDQGLAITSVITGFTPPPVGRGTPMYASGAAAEARYHPFTGAVNSRERVSVTPGCSMDAGQSPWGSPEPGSESPLMSMKSETSPWEGDVVPQQCTAAKSRQSPPGSGFSGVHQTFCMCMEKVSGGESGGAPGVTSPGCQFPWASGDNRGNRKTDMPSPGSKGMPSSPSSSRSCQMSVSTGVP